MKKEIDSNFAIAILALVAACLGFALYFNALSIDNEYKQEQISILKHPSDKQLENTAERIVVPQKIFPTDASGMMLEQLRGKVTSIGQCPPCNTQDDVVCSVCAEVPISVLDDIRNQEIEVYIYRDIAAELEIGQEVIITPDVQKVTDDSSDYSSTYTNTELGFSVKVSPQWNNLSVDSNGPSSKNRTVHFNHSDTYGLESLYQISVLHLDNEAEINALQGVRVRDLGSQFSDRVIESRDILIGGESATSYTVTSASQNVKLHEVYVKRNATLFVISGDGSEDFKSFYQSISFL